MNLEKEEEFHKFKIGDFTCTLILDMQFSYQGQHFFSNIDPSETTSSLLNYRQTPDRIPSPFVSLLLETDDKKVLIDTGMGFMKEPVHFQGNPIMFRGKTASLLRENGTSPDDISHLIITHFHPDHIGGICEVDQKIVYPNAQFIAHQQEFDFWNSPKAINQPEIFKYFINQNINPLLRKNLHLVNKEENPVITGISVVKIPGHTPGQLAVSIESKGEKLLFISDAWLHPLHIEHLDWQTTYDLDHELARKSRIQMLELAYNEQMLVQSFHFDFPGLGHIDKTSSGWKWIPIV